MDNRLGDFLTRLLAIRSNPAEASDDAEQSIAAYYRFLDETGIEHCNFGGFEIGTDGQPTVNQFSGTRLSDPFIEEFTAEMAGDDYVMRRGQTLDAACPVARFGIGLPVLDEIETFHAPSRRVQVECARQGIEEGTALIGDTSLVHGAAKQAGSGRFFGFVFAGEKGTNSVLKDHAQAVEIASFALLDQIMPQIEAVMDGFDNPLTTREREVLAAVAMGRHRKQIAFDLNVSLPTIDLHLTNLKRKLAAATLPEAVAKGYRYGVL